MIRMIVCDDEPNTRFGLRDHFPWSEFGVECVGVAADGEEALDLVFDLAPDLILTDVRMPCMDGIELSNILRAQEYRGKIVFISAYDDIEYLRAALRVEAVDYLVKPVAARELENIVGRAVAAIEQERGRDELFRRGLSSMRDRFLMGLVSREAGDPKRLVERAEYLGLPFRSEEPHAVLAAAVDEEASVLASVSERERGRIVLALAEAFGEEARGRGPSWVFEDWEDRLVCVVGVADKSDLVALAEAFRAAGPRLAGATLTIGIGRPAASLGSVYRSYREAVCALDRRTETGGNAVIEFDDLESSIEDLGGSSAAAEACPDPLPPGGGRGRRVAGRVDEVIAARYAEPLTIKDIAAEVYLSPTYLCLVYKQETGTTINDRLTSFRIEKAKEALRTFDKKAYEVGYEVGYQDPTHFSRTFKRITGMSPSAYRNATEGIEE